jgi:hypothetical protein
LGLGLEDRVEQGRGVAKESSIVLRIAYVSSGLMGEKAEEQETV